MKRFKQIAEDLVDVEDQLSDVALEAKTDGTIWDYAYALGKRNGVRLAFEIVTGQSADHHSQTFELPKAFGPSAEEDDT